MTREWGGRQLIGGCPISRALFAREVGQGEFYEILADHPHCSKSCIVVGVSRTRSSRPF
jgi:hypothetical protein